MTAEEVYIYKEIDNIKHVLELLINASVCHCNSGCGISRRLADLWIEKLNEVKS